MSVTTPVSDPRFPSRGHKRPHTDTTVPPIPDPVSDFSMTPPNPVTGELVTFDGGLSTPDEHIVDYAWEIIGVGQGQGKVVTHAFANPGVQQIRLTVRLADGRSNVRTKGLVVTAAPDVPPDPEVPDE